MRDPAGGTTTYTYDANGNILTITGATGAVTTRTYDTLDRMATQADPLGAVESFAYDLMGNLVRHTDRAHRVRTYGYDLLGRRNTATYGDGTTTQKSWDAVGRVTLVVDSVGGTIVNQYDERDRLVAQITSDGIVSYGYDVASRRTRMDVSGRPTVTYGYDANSRLTDVSSGGRTAQLTYDQAGRRASLNLPNGLRTEYGYDAASRLVSLVYRTPAVVLGELTYDYGVAGYRIRKGSSMADTLLPPAVEAATYDAAGRQLAFGDTQTTFDANGNATVIDGPAGIISLTWDGRGRLSAVNAPGVTAAYTYDSVGRRIRKQVNGSVSRNVYDAADLVEELTSHGPVGYLRSDVIDELLMIERPEGGRFFPAADGIGSTLLVTDESGTTTARYSYEPFGTTSSTNPSMPNPFRFTGRELDETGLYYYRARYYHPSLQRFISEDPIGFAGGDVNLYAYVGGDPVSRTDPSGLEWIYSQSWGRLDYVNPQTGNIATVGTGYSGYGWGFNDPAQQNVPNVGPIPQGEWTIGPQQINVTGTGSVLPGSMRLTPASETETFGRNGFLIHGGSLSTWNSSRGCIILPPAVRNQIGSSGDTTLIVMP